MNHDLVPVALNFRLVDYILASMENDLIVSDPEIMGGTPCIRCTRLTVYAVAARIRGGETVAELLDGYPDLNEKHVQAAIEYADRVPFEEHPDGRPWRKRNPADQAA
jgi:uncharacterized protein (DUF433 family)